MCPQLLIAPVSPQEAQDPGAETAQLAQLEHVEHLAQVVGPAGAPHSSQRGTPLELLGLGPVEARDLSLVVCVDSLFDDAAVDEG